MGNGHSIAIWDSAARERTNGRKRKLCSGVALIVVCLRVGEMLSDLLLPKARNSPVTDEPNVRDGLGCQRVS